MPIRDFRRALGTGKSLSFVKHLACQVEAIANDAEGIGHDLCWLQFGLLFQHNR